MKENNIIKPDLCAENGIEIKSFEGIDNIFMIEAANGKDALYGIDIVLGLDKIQKEKGRIVSTVLVPSSSRDYFPNNVKVIAIVDLQSPNP